MQMVISDLDGTLKEWEQEVTVKDLQTLEELGKKGIVRAIATGRNLYFAKKAIPPDFPIDYLIFSSGAGIVRWIDQHTLYTASIPEKQTASLIGRLQKEQLNFMIHHQIPKEHFFYFEQNTEDATDFKRRITTYKPFATPLADAISHHFPASQALAIIPADESRFTELAASLAEMKIIRTTSPYDNRVIWMEIFPENVSKGAAVRWLCDTLGLHIEQTVGIGNDYNDLDLLKTTGASWVVANAPSPLKAQFKTCPVEKEGFSHAVRQEVCL